jgi:glycosyltransferase involved in cell wall biosynthesis
MKMRGLFCCEWTIYRDDEGNYYDITLTNEVLERYLKVVDELTIAIRVKPLEDKSLINSLSKISLDRVRIVECSNLSSLHGILYERRKVYRTLYDIITTTDLIFVRIPTFIGNTAIKIARKMEKPYLVEVGGCVWDSFWNHSIKGKIVAPFMFFTTRRAVRFASFAVYVTTEFLQRRYPSNGVACACSNVVLHQTESQVLISRLKRIKNYGLKGPIIIGTTAAVNVKYKGQQYIINAIAKLNKEGYNFEYQLVGSGDNSYLRALAEKYGIPDKVKFLGVMRHGDVLEWLDTIDVYAQPSKQEGLPRALIEAMSRGCPAIGSTTAGIPELLCDSMIFRNGNVNEICDKLKFLINNNMEDQAKINFEKAKEYNSEIIEERRLSLFIKYRDMASTVNVNSRN